MSPARAGSFNANFSPETLESFKSLCRDQSRQYTKVLERLAELYLGSQGGILENPEDAILDQGSKLQSEQIASLSQAVKQLETVASMHREDNSELTEQIKNISILLNPIIPISTNKVLDAINLSDKDIIIDNIKNDNILNYNLELKNLDILFKKIENDN